MHVDAVDVRIVPLDDGKAMLLDDAVIDSGVVVDE